MEYQHTYCYNSGGRMLCDSSAFEHLGYCFFLSYSIYLRGVAVVCIFQFQCRLFSREWNCKITGSHLNYQHWELSDVPSIFLPLEAIIGIWKLNPNITMYTLIFGNIGTVTIVPPNRRWDLKGPGSCCQSIAAPCQSSTSLQLR